MAQADEGPSGGQRRASGRPKGTWSEVQPEQIRAFRLEHQLSRATFARMVGVSSPTIFTWETNVKVAALEMQQKMARLLADGPSSLPVDDLPSTSGRSSPSWTPSGFTSNQRVGDSSVADMIGLQISTAGQIVNAYLTGQGKAVSPAELVELIGAVRTALRSSPV